MRWNVCQQASFRTPQTRARQLIDQLYQAASATHCTWGSIRTVCIILAPMFLGSGNASASEDMSDDCSSVGRAREYSKNSDEYVAAVRPREYSSPGPMLRTNSLSVTTVPNPDIDNVSPIQWLASPSKVLLVPARLRVRSAARMECCHKNETQRSPPLLHALGQLLGALRPEFSLSVCHEIKNDMGWFRGAKTGSMVSSASRLFFLFGVSRLVFCFLGVTCIFVCGHDECAPRYFRHLSAMNIKTTLHATAPLLYPCRRYPKCPWRLYASPPPVAMAVVGWFLCFPPFFFFFGKKGFFLHT